MITIVEEKKMMTKEKSMCVPLVSCLLLLLCSPSSSPLTLTHIHTTHETRDPIPGERMRAKHRKERTVVSKKWEPRRGRRGVTSVVVIVLSVLTSNTGSSVVGEVSERQERQEQDTDSGKRDCFALL